MMPTILQNRLFSKHLSGQRSFKSFFRCYVTKKDIPASEKMRKKIEREKHAGKSKLWRVLRKAQNRYKDVF